MSGAVIHVAACSVQHAKQARRAVIGKLVDDTGTLATPGARPSCRAYPGDEGIRLLALLNERVSAGQFGPELTEYFRSTLPQVAAGVDQLLAQGDAPCVLVGLYDVDEKPAASIGDDR